MLKNKKGMALITVIIVLLVLSILGTALISIGMNETRGSVDSERRIKAYYIARSGADAVAAWIEDNSREASAIIPASSEDGEYISDEVDFGEGAFSMKIARDANDPSLIKIESTSTLKNGGTNGKAVITMKETKSFSGDEVFAAALFGETISISGNAKIIGDIEAINDINLKGNKNVDGTIIENSTKVFPEPVFPQLPMRVYNSGGISIDGEYIIPPNSNVVFNTNKNQILKVVIDSLNIRDITVNGEGSVFLFLKNSVKISGNININGGKKKENGDVDPDALFIFGREGNSIEFTGNTEVNGYIYATNSDFIMRGNVDIIGAIVAGEISFGGNTDLYYILPDASVSDEVANYLGTSYKRMGWSSN